ncbi:hypothetical protein [Streptomyces sp. NPDC052012]|uniref:hypothetical protein n=1 Tax=Streptomyces sp. NPDC052012 TaxID=3155051 RepID=UPI00344C16F8
MLYIDEGQVLTSAGNAAGLDLCLHIVRRDHGAAVAAKAPACWRCRLNGPVARPSSSSTACPTAMPPTSVTPRSGCAAS